MKRTRPPSIPGVRRATSLLMLLSILVCSGGCAGVGALGYKIFGAPTQPPLHRPARTPTLIFVENFAHPATSSRHAEMLQHLLYEQFDKHKIAPVIPPDAVMQIKGDLGEAEFQKRSIAAIGQSVGAKQIVYVDLTYAVVEAAVGSDFMRGSASARVRLIDADSGETIWPLEVAQGYPVSWETPLPQVQERQDASLVYAQLHRGMSLRIARLFRKWKADEDGLTYDE